MAFRIKEDGGIIQVRLNPLSSHSSFKHPDYLSYLLKVNRYEIRIIRLNDGRMVVRSESFDVKTSEKFNAAATKYLHEHSNQKSAIIFGPAIVVTNKDWNVD